MIRINVFIRTTESSRQELIETSLELILASQQEDGCVAYDLFESTTRPNTLMICETWQDDAALADHEQTDHFTTLVPRLAALGELKLEKFEF